MQNPAIIRTKTTLHHFYHQNNQIHHYTHCNPAPKPLFNTPNPNFTAHLDNLSRPTILWSDTTINLSTLEDNAPKTQTLLNGNATPHPLFHDDGITLIYTIAPSALIQQTIQSSIPSIPTPIDNLAFPGITALPLAPNHCIIFYTRTGSPAQLGYREFYENQIGKFHPLPTQRIENFCALAANGNLHLLYVTRNYLRLSLIYQQRTENGFTAPTTIHEAQNIINTLLYYHNNETHALVQTDSRLLTIATGPQPATAPRLTHHTLHDGASITKAKYINHETKAPLIAQEVLMDQNQNIQVFPQITGFYPKKQLSSAALPQPSPDEELYNSFFNIPSSPYEDS